MIKKKSASTLALENEREWIKIAEAVMKGKYQKADRSTMESIIIGLQSLNQITAKQAIMRLQEKLKK